MLQATTVKVGSPAGGQRWTATLFLSDVKARYDKMVELVERLLDLHRRLSKATGSAFQWERCGVSL
jgi:hypothetical protein